MSGSSRPTIRVNCPQCLAGLELDSQQAGQRVKCPQCQFSLLVPGTGVAGGNLFEDLFADPQAASSAAPSPDLPELQVPPPAITRPTAEQRPAASQPSAVHSSAPVRPQPADRPKPARPPAARMPPQTPVNYSGPVFELTAPSEPEKGLSPSTEAGSGGPTPKSQISNLKSGGLASADRRARPLQNDFEFDPALLEQPPAGVDADQLSPDGSAETSDPAPSGKPPRFRSQPAPTKPRGDDKQGAVPSRVPAVPGKPVAPARSAPTELPKPGLAAKASPPPSALPPAPVSDDPFDLGVGTPSLPEPRTETAGSHSLPRIQRPAPPATEPAATDPELPPLKLDGFESAGAGPEHTVMTKCRVCESTVYAAASMAGKTVNCPDCGSVVSVVPMPLPKQVLPGWAKPNDDWREVVRQQEEEDFKLAAPIERPPEDWQLPSGWGLGGTSGGDRVPQRELPTAALDDDGEDVLPGVPLERRANQSEVEGAPFIGGVRAAQKQTEVRERQARPAGKKASGLPASAAVVNSGTSAPAARTPAASTGGRILANRDRPQADSASGDGDEDDTQADSADSDAVERFPIRLENLGAFDGTQRKWLGQLARDTELWLRAGGAALALGLACWMNDIVSTAMGAGASENSSAASSMIWIIFPGVLGVLAAMAGCWLAFVTGALVFLQSGDRRPRYAQWPGYGLGDWGEAALFWGVGLAVGAAPGLLLGTPLLFMSGTQGVTILLGFLSACLLSPPLLVSAWHNGSPFRIYARDVVKRFRGSEVHWLRYLPGCAAAGLSFAAGYGVLWIPLVGSSLVGAALIVLGVVLLASFSGLYCGLMSRRIEREMV